jgi:hypothetical protein
MLVVQKRTCGGGVVLVGEEVAVGSLVCVVRSLSPATKPLTYIDMVHATGRRIDQLVGLRAEEDFIDDLAAPSTTILS